MRVTATARAKCQLFVKQRFCEELKPRNLSDPVRIMYQSLLANRFQPARANKYPRKMHKMKGEITAMTPFYVVMFTTTKNHCTRTWQYYTRAKNAKEAATIARAKWRKIGREEHQFHIWASKTYIQDPSRFYVVSERNWIYTGEDCVGTFIPVIR